MNTALDWEGLNKPSKDLSDDGKKLVADLRDVIDKAKILLLTKNQGNLLQDFIWQTQSITANDAKTPNAPVDKETAKQQGNEALEGLRTLGQLLITNGQFRKLRKNPAQDEPPINDTLTCFSERFHRPPARHGWRCRRQHR